MINRNDNYSVIKGILKYIGDIDKIIKDNTVTKEMYVNNILYRHSLHMCLFQIGELSRFIKDDFKIKYLNIPWNEMRGLRNVEAHDYDNLDLNAIWETLTIDIPNLKTKLSNIINK